MLAAEVGDAKLVRWSVGLPAAVGMLWSAWLWRRRAILTSEGVEVRGLLRRAVRFDELREVLWSGRRRRIFFVPMGHTERLVLRGAGRRVVFASDFADFDAHAPRVADLAAAAVATRMREEVLAGRPACIGRRLRVEAGGVAIRRRLGKLRRVPVEDLTVEIADGVMILSGRDGLAARVEIARTPNAIALPQLVADLETHRGRPRPTQLLEALQVREEARSEATSRN